MSKRLHDTAMAVLGPAAPLWRGAERQPRRRRVAAVVALLPGGLDLGGDQRDPAQHHRRARRSACPRDRGRQIHRRCRSPTVVGTGSTGRSRRHVNRPEAANAQTSQLMIESSTPRSTGPTPTTPCGWSCSPARASTSRPATTSRRSCGGTEQWAASRATPEGKLRHEQVMYFDKLRADPRLPQAHDRRRAGRLRRRRADAGGHVRPDRRGRRRAVLQPRAAHGGVGVELLVEPWELGPRKAKEFLLCASTLNADRGRAPRPREPGRGPRRAARPHVREMAETVALVPPITAQAIKDTVNRMVDIQGQREHWRYHFMVHQFVSNTADGARCGRALEHGRRDGRAARAAAGRRLMGGSARRAAGPRPRHPDRRPVLRRAARRDGRRGHQGRAARHRRLHARDRAVRPPSDGTGYSLFWAVEGRGRKQRHHRPAPARGPGPVPPAGRDGRRRGRELPARHARALEHRARPTRPAARDRAHRGVRPGRPVLRAPGPRPAGHRLRRPAAPHRLPRPPAGAGRRHDLRLPHRRLRRPGRRRGAVRARRAAAPARAR